MPCRPAGSPRRALVVFADHTDLAWLKVLGRGFRHCFAVIESAPGGEGGPPAWVIYNPLSHCTEIAIVTGLDGPAIAEHYRAMGYRVVGTRVAQPPERAAPWRPYTCVEAVKRVLGLRAPWVFTPQKLHKILYKENINNFILTKGLNSE